MSFSGIFRLDIRKLSSINYGKTQGALRGINLDYPSNCTVWFVSVQMGDEKSTLLVASLIVGTLKTQCRVAVVFRIKTLLKFLSRIHLSHEDCLCLMTLDDKNLYYPFLLRGYRNFSGVRIICLEVSI